jgi:penicillin-binding protein 1C
MNLSPSQSQHRFWDALKRRWRKSPKGVKRVAIALVLLLTLRSLPYLAPIRLADLAQESQALDFRDRQGLPLGTVLSRDQSHTITVPLAQVSPQFVQAIIAAEDARFYQHGAVDGQAIGRAVLEAVQARQIVSGGSTITMQLARLIDPGSRSLLSKVQEIWTAWRLAAGLSKDEILQTYMNRLPMGSNIYGIEAAARIYFGVPARDLSFAQATLLAAIPNDPNRLDPYRHRAALNQRQAYVVNQLVKHRHLNAAQAAQILKETVAFQPRSQGIIAAPHFLFWLADHLPKSPTPRPNPIQTTLDRPLQTFVETQVQQVIDTLSSQNVHHAAALVLDNHTGAVLAYVGSPNYFVEDQTAEDATHDQARNDGVQALRQPGSTLKPFLYQLALEQRTIRPNTILADVPTRYAIPGAKLYNPADYSEQFQGPVRVRLALANSLNVPAVRVLEKVTVPVFLDRLHHLGFSHLTHPPDHYGLGLTLGSGEVSLWELARAYLTLATHGDITELKVMQADATPVKSSAPNPPSPVAALITDMLSDRHARAHSFGIDSLLSLPFPAAVKTGTSSDFRDTWTVGFTRDYTVAVWVGNFDGAPMHKVSGVTGAAPLWNRILLHLHERQEPKAFDPPNGWVQRPICALSGARPGPGCPAIAQEYFDSQDLPDYATQSDPWFPKGKLQWPPDYTEWLAMQPMQMASGTGSDRIVSPRTGDVFLIDGNAATPQKLEFKLATGSVKPLEWKLNGQVLATQTAHSLFWTAQPGNWTLQVRSLQGKTVNHQVQFEVQAAAMKSARRGFSLGDRSQP